MPSGLRDWAEREGCEDSGDKPPACLGAGLIQSAPLLFGVPGQRNLVSGFSALNLVSSRRFCFSVLCCAPISRCSVSRTATCQPSQGVLLLPVANLVNKLLADLKHMDDVLSSASFREFVADGVGLTMELVQRRHADHARESWGLLTEEVALSCPTRSVTRSSKRSRGPPRSLRTWSTMLVLNPVPGGST